MVKKTVEVSEDDKEFLEENPDINFSGLARSALEEKKKERGWK